MTIDIETVIDNTETLSRFLFSRSQYKPSDGTVKYGAFMPASNGETSVFRTSGLDETAIWSIGNDIRDIPLLGRADITALTVMENGLDVVPVEPPIRHANIQSWPSEREEQRLAAIELAEAASLFL